ncbi:helix-turn-helix domain-containing protein [Ligilactobacillus sp. 110_WCHN]|uniref:helix-turn-helix domain-containing protein n=1 Tax=Ligilactobacillus sp. 110_WCHN TaxID=3057125 RepID=UPI0034A0AAD8
MIENRLKVILAEKRLKIKDVAQNTSLSRNTISNIANNPYSNVSNSTLNKLCECLNITPADFFLYKKEDSR